MSSKQISIVIGVLALFGVSAYFVMSKNKPEPQKTSTEVMVTPTPQPVKMLTWNDEAGFTFQYPEGTTINTHPEDNKNYANLTLTLPSKDLVNIVMADNKYKNLQDWAGENAGIDTTLQERPALKSVIDGIETVACIDNDVIVTISGKDTAQIRDSWAFVYPTPAATAKSAGSGSTSESEDVLVEE